MYVDEPPTPNSPSEHRASTAQRARLLLAQGGLAAAARWTEERGLAAGDEPTYQREREYLVLARVVLAQDCPAQAVALLERLHAAAAAQNRAGSVIETQALRALALAASGEEAGVVDVLAGVLTPSLARAMPECSPTRVRRWARCWADWSRPRRQYRPPRAASLHPVWPGSCGSSARSLLGRAPGNTPWQRRDWSSS